MTDDITMEKNDDSATEHSEETVAPGIEEVTSPTTTTEIEIYDIEDGGDGYLNIDDI